MKLRASLLFAGVMVNGVANVDGPSGTAVILVTLAGDNSIISIPGANVSLLSADLALYKDIFQDAAMVLAQLEIPPET